MPLIDAYVPAGTLSEEAAAQLLDDLATTLLRWEGAPDTDFFREITWVYLHEVEPGRVAVGGRPGGAPRFRINVTVPAGALSDRRKAGLVGDVHQLVAAAAGIDPQGERAAHIWTLVNEVPEGNWGAGGQVIRFADLKNLSAVERQSADA
ncbi:tautomerase family protein [Millisia brevis]|uniref:tautomerase family protein n=1 Tax=Millisia brevis TaxID=264148 RepID=UPI00082FC500|nr:tautomerase family protein [Millisia brevis]